jgi:RNA polymerase sigma-70 factor (sigma-E family)
MRSSEEDAFRRYAVARTPVLLRIAYLMCGDWHRAEDIVSTATVKLYLAWRTASRASNVDAYARQIVVRTFLDERRRPWRREHVAADLPDHAATGGEFAADAAARLDLRRVLATMPPRQRAVLVLRYYEDLSIEQTADALRCSPGAVKSLTHRALETLRDLLPADTFRLWEAR